MRYFKYLKNRRKLNKYRGKLPLTQFFAEFHVLKGAVWL